MNETPVVLLGKSRGVAGGSRVALRDCLSNFKPHYPHPLLLLPPEIFR
jgi:hypothetical protein